MRDAINSNPIAQIGVVAVLLVVTGLMLMAGPLKKEEAAKTPAVSDPTVEGSTAAAPAAVGAAAPVVPGPALPRAVTAAQQAGKVLALMVVRAGGPDDRLLRGAVTKLRSVPGLAFFTTRAEGIARFARITQGVKVDRVPALIVVRPPPAGATVATAEVRYGFRDAESVVQAVRDALYRGPAVGYSPD